MAKDQLWFGYLNAGAQSSPVLHDPALDTGSKKTLYLYNHERKAILEYRREIVESKLRDLKPEEAELVEALREGYAEAQRGFRGLRLKPSEVPAQASPIASSDDSDELEEEVDEEGLDEDVEVDGGSATDEEWDEEES